MEPNMTIVTSTTTLPQSTRSKYPPFKFDPEATIKTQSLQSSNSKRLAKDLGMRELVIVGSSLLLPPNPTPSHRYPISSKYKPSPLSSISHSPAKSTCLSPDRTAGADAGTRPARTPLLMNVGQDLTRQGRHLKYYADLASKLVEDGRLEDFLMIAESVLVSGSETETLQFAASLNIKLVSAGILRFLRQGRVQTVVEFLNKVQKLGLSPSALFDESAKEFLTLECRRLLEAGKLEEFVDLMDILAGFQFCIKEFIDPLEIVAMCTEKRNPHLAVRYVSMLPDAHVLFSSIIHEFGKRQDLASALIAYEASRSKSDKPNMYACRTIIDVCGVCGDSLRSRYIYKDLLAQKVIPNTYVFNSLMNVNANDLNHTLYVYKQMQSLGVIADVASYNILLKACSLAERVDLAQEIYKEIKHMASKGALKLDVITYSTIVKVFADAKMWQMALKVKEDMLLSGVTPNLVTWSSLINAFANAGLVEKAIQVFEEMLLAGSEPNTQCCNILLHACVEACQYDRAFRMFQSWKESGVWKICDTKLSNGKMHNLVTRQTDNASEDCDMPGGVSDPHHSNFIKPFPFAPTTTTYNILMKACGTDYYRAKALMEEMKTAGLSPNHISWTILIDIGGNSGNAGGAMQALKTMQDAGIKPDVVAYTSAIKACVENKKLEIAFLLFEEMKRHRLKPNLVTYNTLLRARSRYGSVQEVQQCLAIYQDMRKAGYNSNDYYLKQLIEEWCEGVIQDSNQNQGLLASGSSSIKTDLKKPQSFLLEKVAGHLQKDITESLMMDLRGLTKVEARIVVLAVLWMIKESCALGNPIKDDMNIILGTKGKGPGTNHVSEVQDAVIKLLQNELGLEVILEGPRIPITRNDFGSPFTLDMNNENQVNNRLPIDFEPMARRPAVLQRLKVTRKSLYHWLQRRVGVIRR
ncbi:pentatricopeptide repeat-containing protein At5g02830, chloroplastic [Macadamia integrifolia]|uniref:pentatricopeptide repeat-containing protein At5g02830, chloroplastic n=1 Tax=Macadamia integrifolia TaxID=60698 RepID=UPI001C4F9B0D|nr:pentatricopeptide repeat-containing protein At5g02830, chloroplastic [Macadamia integrifolia]